MSTTSSSGPALLSLPSSAFILSILHIPMHHSIYARPGCSCNCGLAVQLPPPVSSTTQDPQSFRESRIRLARGVPLPCSMCLLQIPTTGPRHSRPAVGFRVPLQLVSLSPWIFPVRFPSRSRRIFSMALLHRFFGLYFLLSFISPLYAWKTT